MEDKCPLNNTELVEKAQEWVSKLCKTGGQAWSLRIPVDLKHDPDVVISELANRYKEALALLEKASGLVGNPATGISSSTDLAADNWQEEHSKFVEKYGN